MNILFLAQDLSDAAVARRVLMLRTGGATVSVAGFRRTQVIISGNKDYPTLDFGQTKNGNFSQRLSMILYTLLHLKLYRALFADADVIIARNLEMLVIAVAGARHVPRKPIIIYEILDIHRLLLGSGIISKGLRLIEKQLLRQTKAILTSSPCFIAQYFHKLNPTPLPIRLVENKLVQLASNQIGAVSRPAQQPWMIGWFGIIRCRRSLHILADMVQQSSGLIEVVIRGRPALDEIPEFHDVISTTPGLRFNGPYKNPDDLASIYGTVHFIWAIDMYEQGLNSSWLLPNRMYEGCYFGAVPIAAQDVETGKYLKNLGIGVLLPHPLMSSLRDFMTCLTPEAYKTLATAVRAVPASQWACDSDECKELVRFISRLKAGIRGNPV